jgi:hypothetical protein
MVPTTSQPSLYDTLTGLIRLVLVVLAVPAVLAGAVAACVLAVVGTPVVLGARALRHLKMASGNAGWAASNVI